VIALRRKRVSIGKKAGKESARREGAVIERVRPSGVVLILRRFQGFREANPRRDRSRRRDPLAARSGQSARSADEVDPREPALQLRATTGS
jgi:hypothetical protein